LLKDLPAGFGPDAAAGVVFSPDGRQLVTSPGHELCFWEVGSWTLTRQVPQVANSFLAALAFSPDGKIFAKTESQNKIRLYNAMTGAVLADLEPQDPRMITALAFSRDGTQLAFCASADAVRVWDLRFIRRQLAELHLDWDQPPYPDTVADPVPPSQRAAAALGSGVSPQR
jgi:WD40 repeat protein